MNTDVLSSSRNFSLVEVAGGVYAAIASEYGAAVANAGLVDLGGRTLVFDTFLTPQAATDLRQAALQLFDRPVAYVINSHYHNDHIWGNQVFAGEAALISSARTRDLITTAGKEEFDGYSANTTSQLRHFQEQYRQADNEDGRQAAGFWMHYYQVLAEALPGLRVCLPNLTFEGSLELHGACYSARLQSFKGAHTGDDSVLYLPQAGVLFMSDLLFVGCHPYLADGDPLQLLNALQSLARLDAEVFVPGHGPPGTRADLDAMSAYVEHCLETAGALVQQSGDLDEVILRQSPPEPFRAWRYPRFYHSNLRFLCHRMRPGGEGEQS